MVVKLRLENAEEILHDTVVVAISLSRHALANSFVF